MCKWLNEEMNSQAEMTYYKSIIFSQQVRNCRLTGLLDLALEKDYVRSKVADYMNHLIDIGVAGFRLDAAKHMWPGDIKAVLDKLHNLNTKWFSQGSRPFIFQEVDQYIIFKILILLFNYSVSSFPFIPPHTSMYLPSILSFKFILYVFT